MKRTAAPRTMRRLSVEALEDRNLLAALPRAAALVDDAYEQNDTRQTAKDLGRLTTNRVISNLVQADANDWYRFTTTRTAAAGSNVSTTFTHARGDLDLELYNASGARIRVSQGITNGEAVSLAGLAAGTYYVRVYGYRGVTNPNYSLSLNVGSAVQLPTDDAYENNDTRATASNLGTLTSNASVTNLMLRDSADWFRFTTTATGTSAHRATINFQNAQGNLALQLVNANGTVLATSNGSGNSESLSLAGRAAGTYYVRVYSPTGGYNPNYSLQILAPQPVAPPPPPPATAGAFDIQINYAGFTPSQRAIFERAAAEWESIIVGDLPNATYNGVVIDDLLIEATSTAIDGVGGTLGQAGYDRTRTTGTRLPYHGSMEFDSADLASMEASGTLLNVIVHEIGHVLGIGTLWQSKGLLVGAGTSNPLFVGRQAVAAYNAIFGTAVSGVPVENAGGGGTRDSHWRDATFHNEIMTGYINGGANPLSRITVASLADLGYTVNLSRADAYARPGIASVVSQSASSSSRVASRNPNVVESEVHSEPASAAPDRVHDEDLRQLTMAAILAILNQPNQPLQSNLWTDATNGARLAEQLAWATAVELLFAGEADWAAGPAE